MRWGCSPPLSFCSWAGLGSALQMGAGHASQPQAPLGDGKPPVFQAAHLAPPAWAPAVGSDGSWPRPRREGEFMGLAESLKGNTATDFEVRVVGGHTSPGSSSCTEQTQNQAEGARGQRGAVPAGLCPFSHLG